MLPVVLLLAWEYYASQGRLPRYFPAPSSIGLQWLEMAGSGELLRNTVWSLYRALAAFALGAFFGALAGLLSGTVGAVERFLDPIISLTYPIPKIAALPIVFALFGLGELSKIVIICISVFFPAYLAAFSGAKATSRVHVWAARNMGARPVQVFFRVVLPSALPEFFNGLRVALAFSFIVMFVAEVVSSTKGLGHLIVFAEENTRFDIMYVAIISIGIIGLLADRLLLAVRSRLLVGQLAVTEGGR
ncbi:MAG: ABC transporter permease [Deltaproteobacteria bacterium]|nr:ABC transporter permease [Deltaproteobacteria bacterium]